MERTGRISKWYLIILLFSMIAITMSGCVYVNNKNWDYMTPEEQEEVRQNFEEERKELEEDFSSDSVEGKFTSYILDKIEYCLPMVAIYPNGKLATFFISETNKTT